MKRLTAIGGIAAFVAVLATAYVLVESSSHKPPHSVSESKRILVEVQHALLNRTAKQCHQIDKNSREDSSLVNAVLDSTIEDVTWWGPADSSLREFDLEMVLPVDLEDRKFVLILVRLRNGHCEKFTLVEAMS